MDELLVAIGLIGVVIVLAAYGLLTTGRLNAADRRYPIMNLIGSGCILASLVAQWNLAGFLANSAWFVIALISLVRGLRAKGA